MNYSVILLAAGKGTRTHLAYNKVLYELRPGYCVLDASIDAFLQDPECTQIIIACSKEELESMKERFESYDPQKIEFVCGGKTRQDSCLNALKKASEPYVMIHDAARPFLQRKEIEKIKEALTAEKAVLLAVPSTDTIKMATSDGYVEKTLKRELTWNAQTPQSFETNLILKAYLQAEESGIQATDDCSLVEMLEMAPVKIVEGDPGNIKITHPDDLNRFR